MAKKKTHCKYGHPLIKENLVLSDLKRGKRRCKTCRNEMDKQRRNPKGNLSPALINKEKTHCINGHPLSGANLRIDKTGRRICRTCKRLTGRKIAKTPEHQEYQSKWKKDNKTRVSKYNKKYRKQHPEYSTNWDRKNPSKRKAILKKHNAKPERKAYVKNWQRLNPRSGTDRPEDVKESMMNTRIRNHNTCQWYGCGRTPKVMSIAVHHIFPIEEYPRLAAVEQYQICYCAEHHYLWHKARGDDCQHVLKGSIPRHTYEEKP